MPDAPCARRATRDPVWRSRPALVAALATAVLLWGACGSQAQESDSAPGYDGRNEPVDTTPFRLAGPSTTEGPTTVPGGGSGRGSTTSTTTTPTTTTAPPLFLPPASSITTICGLSRSIASLFAGSDPIAPDEVRQTLDRILENLDRYLSVAPADVGPDIEVIREVMGEVSAFFEEGGRDVTYPPLLEVLTAAGRAQAPYQRVLPALERIAAVERESCDA